MWTYIPYQSAQDTEESNWDLERLSQELEQSATWKTKSLSSKSWLRVLKTEDLTMLRSGLTLEPSMRQPLVDEYISSLAVSPASRIPWRERNSETMTQENSQDRFSVSQTNSGDQLSFLKMFQASSDSTGTTSDPSFKRWDTELKKSLSVRKKQAPLIFGTAYLSSPTLGTRTSLDGSKKPKTNWPTMSASEHKYRLKGNTQQSNCLMSQVRRWTTDSSLCPPIPRTQTTETDGHTCCPKCHRLSPAFAEWHQGLPHGWISDSEALEMESFQHQQQLLSLYLSSVLGVSDD